MDTKKVFFYINSKGIKFYLNKKTNYLQGGRKQELYFFTKEIQVNSSELPKDKYVIEIPEDDPNFPCHPQLTSETSDNYVPNKNSGHIDVKMDERDKKHRLDEERVKKEWVKKEGKGRRYIHLKEFPVEHISERFKDSVYVFYEAVFDDPDNWDYADYHELHTVYNGEIDKMPDFSEKERQEYNDVYSREQDITKAWFDDSLEDESHWNVCWKSNEEDEFNEAVKKILQQYCKKKPNSINHISANRRGCVSIFIIGFLITVLLNF